MHTVTWVVLTFSSAMPLLYAVGAVYYIGIYWIDKYLMLNFYRKSQTFNEYVPVKSLDLFKYPVLIHGIISILMFSNLQVFHTKNTPGFEWT